MKTLTFTFCIAFLVSNALLAQDYTNEFGQITQYEIDMKSYDKDPEAAAVVIYDIGESVFTDTQTGYDIRFTRTKKIKVFSDAGAIYAEIKVPYYVDGYGKTEKVKTIEATSYNLENSKLTRKSLNTDNVYDEIISDHWRAKKFVIPDVKAGTVIEYKVVLETPFHFNLPDWTFQDNIPTIYSKYTVSLIPFYEYVFIAQGFSKFTYQTSKVSEGIERHFQNIKFNDMVHTYVMKNVPAFTDEAYITSEDDYLMKMDFQLAKFHSPTGNTSNIITTWDELKKSLLKHTDFGRYIKKSGSYAQDIINTELQLEGLNQYEKAKKIIDYVKSSFSWNGYFSKYTSKGPKELVREKTGNAADINLFLMAALQEAGLDAKPVIISTRDHGKITTDYPFSHFFNDVILLVAIDENYFLTDGTESHIAFNRIPPVCINDKGLIVDDHEINWINLNTNSISFNIKQINIALDTTDHSLDVRVVNQMTEFESLDYKKSCNDDSVKLQNEIVNQGFAEISRIKSLNFSEGEKPYILAYEGKVKAEVIDNKYLINPFLYFPIKENKLTQKTRSYPVDFIYPISESFNSTINIPENFTVLDMPDNVEISNELADIKLKFTKTTNAVKAEGNYTFKKSTYAPNEYARIKFYLDTIVKKFNTQIVLGKPI